MSDIGARFFIFVLDWAKDESTESIKKSPNQITVKSYSTNEIYPNEREKKKLKRETKSHKKMKFSYLFYAFQLFFFA